MYALCIQPRSGTGVKPGAFGPRSRIPQETTTSRKAAQATGSVDDATRAKMADLQQKQAAEIRAILTADQQTTFDKNLAAMKERMAERRNGSS